MTAFRNQLDQPLLDLGPYRERYLAPLQALLRVDGKRALLLFVLPFVAVLVAGLETYLVAPDAFGVLLFAFVLFPAALGFGEAIAFIVVWTHSIRNALAIVKLLPEIAMRAAGDAAALSSGEKALSHEQVKELVVEAHDEVFVPLVKGAVEEEYGQILGTLLSIQLGFVAMVTRRALRLAVDQLDARQLAEIAAAVLEQTSFDADGLGEAIEGFLRRLRGVGTTIAVLIAIGTGFVAFGILLALPSFL